ncbi:hypothetical protein CCR94_14980 [Rhodoblastus sphagnicola]|uniref:EamA domain-containing protein n=1 Tax=Rhodoblastus sphagnicola TaxID=333368 RepID=A0A2S6N4W8_9HYPH|nr:DMT family transporter [Rhodoblastus sphagnicola]MBB4199621.1 drug/metabolite transporter (DMT)-like permease [Rhodoblastus sphagnicola]PPQ29627.1 hypothetical protein CCR94_14980 [Rhodoblastus sphagnicola]
MPAISFNGLIAGVLFAAFWSGSFIAIKFALPLAPPLWLAAGRLVAASLVLLAVFARPAMRIIRDASPRMRWRMLAAAVLTQSYYLGATFHALVTLPAALVSILGSSLPLISIPMATAMLGEKASPREVVATLVGIAGIVVAILGKPGADGLTDALLSPSILVMLSGVLALAFGNTLLKSIVSKSDVVPLVATQMAGGGFVLLLFAISVEGPPHFDWKFTASFGFAYLVFMGSIAATWMWIVTLHRFSAIGASGFFLLIPVFGIVFGRLFLDEVVTPLQLLGTAVLCAMILVRSLSISKRETR